VVEEVTEAVVVAVAEVIKTNTSKDPRLPTIKEMVRTTPRVTELTKHAIKTTIKDCQTISSMIGSNKTRDKRDINKTSTSISLINASKLCSKRMLVSMEESRLKALRVVSRPTRTSGQLPSSLVMLKKRRLCMQKSLSTLKKIMVRGTEETRPQLSTTSRTS